MPGLQGCQGRRVRWTSTPRAKTPGRTSPSGRGGGTSSWSSCCLRHAKADVDSVDQLLVGRRYRGVAGGGHEAAGQATARGGQGRRRL